MDLADSISAQAQELWSHLPADEVGDDEELAFKTDDQGRLLVAGQYASYKLQAGTAWRYRPTGGGEEITTWRNRRELTRTVEPADPSQN